MKEFTFDLQRFADICKIERTGTIYSSFSAAYNAAIAGDTITFLAGRTENGFTISKNITVDLGGFTLGIKNTSYDDGYGSRAYTISSTVTFKNGTISSSYVNPLVNGSGNLIISDLKTARSISSGTVTVGSGNNIVAGSGTFVLENGVKLNSTATGTMTLTTAADKTASVVLNNGRTLTAKESSSREVTYKASGTAITLDYNSSGAASVTNLAEGSTLSVSVNNDNKTATTYNVTAGGLQAVRNGKLKVLENVAITASSTFNIEKELDYSDAKFTSAFLTDTSNNNNLTISNSLDLNETLKVIDSNDYSQKYGYLTKIANDTYTLNANDKTKALSGITINDGLTVRLTKDFADVPITVSKASTTFQYVTGNDVTLSSVKKFSSSSSSTVQAASVTGAVNVSLSSGAVKIAESDDTLKPTVNAGNYAVSYATGSGDGVAVVIDGTSTQVSGIEKGESFIVNGTTYYRDDVGLRTGDRVFTSDVASLSGGDDGYAAIELANLQDSLGEFVTPENKVLEIGKTNNDYAVIVDDNDDPKNKYAEIVVQKSSSSGNLYTLRAADGVADKFTDAVDTISLTGGAGTVIDKNLVKDVEIVASSGIRPDATFSVTAVTGDTFTVNLKNTTTSGATEISTDATGITLQSGTINAKAGQTITLGEKGRELKVTTSSAGMEVTVDVTTATDAEGITTYTATIKGAANDVFSIDGKEYTIDKNSDGMTFTVTADNVIVSDLDTADKDAFTYEGATYSVRGAGFVMTKSGKHSLWSYKKDNGHSISGGTVTIESLTASDHTWNPTASVRASDNSATLPPDNNDMKVTLVGNDFKQTYGTFTKSGTNVTLEGGSSKTNEAKLSRISVGSAVDQFKFGEDLTDISIVSGETTFIVTEDDTLDGGYKVTLTSSSPAMVSSAKRASLISGSLQSDSYFTATVRDNYIIAQGDASLTLIAGTSDASVTGLTVGQSFSIEGHNNYVMSKVGLVDNNSHYLPGTREGNPIILSSLNSAAAWGGLIDKDAEKPP